MAAVQPHQVARRRAQRRASDQARRFFTGSVERITEQWALQRQAAAGGRGRHGPHDQFKRDAYRLLKAAVDHNRTAIVQEAARRQAVTTGERVPRTNNIFDVGLFAIVVEGAISRPKRSEWAREMLYAYRHAVHSSLMTAFVGWAGTPTAETLKDKRRREPGFERRRPKKDI